MLPIHSASASGPNVHESAIPPRPFWMVQQGDHTAPVEIMLPPSRVSLLNEGAARLRVLTGDRFRSSVVMPGGETMRMSSARWLQKKYFGQGSPSVVENMIKALLSPQTLQPIGSANRPCYRDPVTGAEFHLSRHRDGTKKFELSSVVFKNVRHHTTEPPETLPDDPLQRANLLRAREALLDIRENVYKPHYKSENKLSAKRPRDYELWRRRMAVKEILRVRALPHSADTMYTARAHNCGELIIASGTLLPSAQMVTIEGKTHWFGIVGEFQGELPADMKDWPPHLAIVDPWTNIACLAKDYPARFKAKMQKWAEEHKTIVIDKTEIPPGTPDEKIVSVDRSPDDPNVITRYWIESSPTDPEWIDRVLSGRRNLLPMLA